MQLHPYIFSILIGIMFSNLRLYETTTSWAVFAKFSKNSYVAYSMHDPRTVSSTSKNVQALLYIFNSKLDKINQTMSYQNITIIRQNEKIFHLAGEIKTLEDTLNYLCDSVQNIQTKQYDLQLG